MTPGWCKGPNQKNRLNITPDPGGHRCACFSVQHSDGSVWTVCCVTRRKQHRPGIAPNANTTHVPTAGSSAAPVCCVVGTFGGPVDLSLSQTGERMRAMTAACGNSHAHQPHQQPQQLELHRRQSSQARLAPRDSPVVGQTAKNKDLSITGVLLGKYSLVSTAW